MSPPLAPRWLRRRVTHVSRRGRGAQAWPPIGVAASRPEAHLARGGSIEAILSLALSMAGVSCRLRPLSTRAGICCQEHLPPRRLLSGRRSTISDRRGRPRRERVLAPSPKSNPARNVGLGNVWHRHKTPRSVVLCGHHQQKPSRLQPQRGSSNFLRCICFDVVEAKSVSQMGQDKSAFSEVLHRCLKQEDVNACVNCRSSSYGDHSGIC
jgi:hypothetical protein